MPDVLITQSLTTLDQAVVIGCEDNPLVGLEVSGTWAGTLNVEASVDPTNPLWAAAPVFTSAGVGATSTLTANARRLVNAVGVGQIRVRFNPATSGAAVVTLRAGDGSLSSGGGGGGGAVTVADGADVAQGTTSDVGIITDIAGTSIGFLRGAILRWNTFLARLPAALVSGRLDVNLGAAPATVTVVESGLLSTNNSSTAILTANSVFTGTGDDVSAYGGLSLIVTADVASAAQGVSLQWSSDGTNWDFKQTFTYNSQPVGNVITTAVYAKFFRVVYTNGGSNQASFRLQSVLHPNAQFPSVTAGTTLSGTNFVNPLVIIGGVDSGITARAFTITAGTDGSSSTLNQVETKAHLYAYNGATEDRVRANIITNNVNGAVTVTTNHPTQTNYNNTGLLATLNITAVTGTTPTLDIKLQVADGAGTFFDLIDSAGNTVGFQQKTATGTDTLKIAPGLVERLGAAANRQYAGQIGRSYRFVSTVGGTTPSFTIRLDVSELK